MPIGETEAAMLVIVGGLIASVVAVLVLRRRRRDDWDEDSDPPRDLPELSPAISNLLKPARVEQPRLRIPPRAEQPGRIPSPGVLSVAGVELPAGRPTRPVNAPVVELVVRAGESGSGSATAQLWVSRDATAAAAGHWRQLAAGFTETGLWPLLLPATSPSSAAGEDGEWFDEPARRHDVDRHSPAERFRTRLAGSLAGGSPLASTEQLAASAVARGELGRGSGRRTDALAVAFERLGPMRLALAPACRPADVLHALAWPGADAAEIPSGELADLVASWEERYGALLVSIDAASILLAVLRPPANVAEAIEAVAELHALCPDEAAEWGDDAAAAAALVDEPVWRLSWH
jgi:LPXTG-motif cell wall-anchored protein